MIALEQLLILLCYSLTPFGNSLNQINHPQSITTIDALQRRSKSAQSWSTLIDERETELNCSVHFITLECTKMVY